MLRPRLTIDATRPTSHEIDSLTRTILINGHDAHPRDDGDGISLSDLILPFYSENLGDGQR